MLLWLFSNHVYYQIGFGCEFLWTFRTVHFVHFLLALVALVHDSIAVLLRQMTANDSGLTLLFIPFKGVPFVPLTNNDTQSSAT